jgi:lipopolysaccharide biosynthesis protein
MPLSYLSYFTNFCRYLYLKFFEFLYFFRSIFQKKYEHKFESIICKIEINSRKRICVFSHFSKDNLVDDYTLHYIKSLYELDCAIVFVSTSKFLDEKSINKIQDYVSYIIIRENICYDFGSYHLGYELVKKYLKNDSVLIFANDSVYGPIFDLRESIESIITNSDAESSAEFIGMTDSYCIRYHIQSYFLVFLNNAFSEKILGEFFKDFTFSNDKRFVVYKYELGLTKFMISKNIKTKALWCYKDIFGLEKSFKDSTVEHAVELIEEHKFPFLKKKLFKMFLGKRDLYDKIMRK